MDGDRGLHLSIPDEVSSESIDDCINMLKARYILDLVQHGDDINVADLIELAKNQKVYKSSHFSSLIGLMKNVARDRSHGAVKLTYVFVSKYAYLSLLEELSLVGEPRIDYLGVSVKVDSSLGDLNVVGICKPKFKYIDLDNLIIIGERLTNDHSS